jgi:argininosuccinate synthase
VLLDQDDFADEQCAARSSRTRCTREVSVVSRASRPVIARAVAEIALDLEAEAVVHGCTGKGNDQLRSSSRSRPIIRT